LHDIEHNLVIRFTRRGIASHAGGAFAHLQDAELGNLHPLALLQMFGDHPDEFFHHFQTLLLVAEVMLLCEHVSQMLGG
jgi:hypothetical protein